MTESDFDYLIQSRGWVRFPAVLPADLIGALRQDLERVYEIRRAVQIKNGIAAGMEGTCHHLVGEGGPLDRFVAMLPLDDFLRRFFAGPYILNSYGAVLNFPVTTAPTQAYVGKIHRDVRTFAGHFRLLINMLVFLDDFTEENGATWFLTGSHHSAERPSDEIFHTFGTQALGKAGDIVMFDSNLWHAAGVNHNQGTRRGLTLNYSRPFFKPQLDYPRLLGPDFGKTEDPRFRQVLGYDARMPADLDEYYQPPEHRAYKPGQG